MWLNSDDLYKSGEVECSMSLLSMEPTIPGKHVFRNLHKESNIVYCIHCGLEEILEKTINRSEFGGKSGE